MEAANSPNSQLNDWRIWRPQAVHASDTILQLRTNLGVVIINKEWLENIVWSVGK